MYKKFIEALTWNSINIFAYKAILLTHQIILFYFLPKATYGASGSIFASIYLAIGFTGFGFDYTLFTFFAHHTQSKQHFKNLIPQYIYRIASIIIVAAAIGIITIQYPQAKPIKFLIESIPPTLLPYLLLIFVSESIKRSLETLAQLSFLNKEIAKIQISMIASYVVLFWGSYISIQQITLYSIFLPMLIISCGEIILLTTLLFKYYNSLPEKAQTADSVPKHTMAKEQLYNYANQVTKSFFSPNFLMLVIAYNFGMAQAGSIRFFTNTITLFYMLLNRSIGIPSGALMSNITQQDFKKTKQAFLDITNIYIQFLYVLGIAILVNIVPHLNMHDVNNTTITYHVLFFISAGFVEYITLTYEKLYITQRSAQYLATINISSLILLMITLLAPLNIPQHFILMPICLIRICTAWLVGLYAYKRWAIRPSLAINLRTILISILSAATIKALVALYQKSL